MRPLVDVNNGSFSPFFLECGREPTFCKCSSCSRSSCCQHRHTFEATWTCWEVVLPHTKRCIPHFPLSLTASSNLPSPIATVTSLVWGWRKRTERKLGFSLGNAAHLQNPVASLLTSRLVIFDPPLAHTPSEAAWQPCSQTGWPHRQECLVWPPAEP